MYNNNSNVTNGFNQLTTLLEKSFVKLELLLYIRFRVYIKFSVVYNLY